MILIFQKIGSFFASIADWFARLKPFSNPYVQFVLIIIAAIGVAVIMQAAIKSRNLKSIKNKAIRALIEKSFTRNIIALGVTIGVYFSLSRLGLQPEVLKALLRITLSLILLFSLFIVRNLIRFGFEILSQTRKKDQPLFRNKNYAQFGKRISQILVFVIVATLGLEVWGVEVGALLAGLGIAGIAVGLALQDSLSNVIGGIALVLDDVYREDEMIETENGVIGSVYAIGYRSTKLKTINEEIVNIPNGKLSQMNVKNLSRPGSLYRLSIDISAAYGSDPDYVKHVVLEELEKIPGVLEFPEPLVFFMEMADFSLKFRILAYIQNVTEKFIVTDAILTAVYKAFDLYGISIPFPTTTVKFDAPPETMSVKGRGKK